MTALALLGACETVPPAETAESAAPEACPNAAACDIASLIADELWADRASGEYHDMRVERVEAQGPVVLVEMRFPFSSGDLARSNLNKAQLQRVITEEFTADFCDGSAEAEAFMALGAKFRLRYLTSNRVLFYDHTIESC
ncbi:hypothetical protein ACXN5S_17440 [Pseudoroseicyclus sp. H15]